MIRTAVRIIVILFFIGWVVSVGPIGVIQAVVGLGVSVYHLVPGISHTIGSAAHSVLGTNPNTIKP